jgi:mono/diheme cytochrome c family protein
MRSLWCLPLLLLLAPSAPAQCHIGYGSYGHAAYTPTYNYGHYYTPYYSYYATPYYYPPPYSVGYSDGAGKDLEKDLLKVRNELLELKYQGLKDKFDAKAQVQPKPDVPPPPPSGFKAAAPKPVMPEAAQEIPAGKDVLAVVGARCAKCHADDRAKDSGGGFVLMKGNALAPLTEAGRLKVLAELAKGTMPKGGAKMEEKEAQILIGAMLGVAP